MVHLKTGPISWTKNIRVTVPEIRYLETVTIRKKNNKGESYYVQELIANLQNGQRVKIIGANGSVSWPLEEVEFIRKKINAYL